MVAWAADRIAIMGGAALIVYGAWLLSQPVAFIVTGTLLIAGAIWRRP